MKRKTKKKPSLKKYYVEIQKSKLLKYNKKMKEITFDICRLLYNRITDDLFETMRDACEANRPETFCVSASIDMIRPSLNKSVVAILKEYFPLRMKKIKKKRRKKRGD